MEIRSIYDKVLKIRTQEIFFNTRKYIHPMIYSPSLQDSYEDKNVGILLFCFMLFIFLNSEIKIHVNFSLIIEIKYQALYKEKDVV